MGTCWIKTGIAAGLLTAGSLSAETLYEQDGIILEGSVRLVHRDAASCQVLEESESPETYEATKANHGRPLHVWRLDYGAFNGSGKSLGQLTAHFRIESEWPPCTNWTGLGQYPGPVQWAGSFETLQRTGGLEAGGEARETLYVLAIDGEQPRFRNWQLDFLFGEASTEVAPEPPPTVPAPEPLCRGQADENPCWIALATHPGCYTWNPNPQQNEIVRWSGQCSDGRPDGLGTLDWIHDGGWQTSTGTFRRGRSHGHWTNRDFDGSSSEGPYVDGERHGTWVFRFADGTAVIREFVHGEAQQ